MEYIDILNENGAFAGKCLPKEEVHAKGYWHRTVHIWIVNENGQILLQKRSAEKILYPNMWDISAAGHISAGEGSMISAIREVHEELGILLSSEDLEFLFTCKSQVVENNGTFIDNEFHDVFLVKMNLNINELSLQKEEVSDVMWISIEELEGKFKNKDEDFVLHIQEWDILLNILKGASI